MSRSRATVGPVHTIAGASGEAGGVLPEHLVVRLLLVLAAAAGCVDVVCVTRLGGPFASVITGNLVQLGRAVAALDGRLAVSATTAVAAYALGVAGATTGLRDRPAGWRRRTTRVAAGELVMLVCVAAGWLATSGRPDATISWLLLALAAAAMGVQSTITIRSGVRGASTTYLTGTLTEVVRAAAGEGRRFVATAGGIGRLAALLCGAIVGGLLLRVTPSFAPALPVVLVGAVVTIAALAIRDGPDEERDPD
jgi:uncharacterized membrane protein YoaK (UPF0700 family)